MFTWLRNTHKNSSRHQFCSHRLPANITRSSSSRHHRHPQFSSSWLPLCHHSMKRRLSFMFWSKNQNNCSWTHRHCLNRCDHQANRKSISSNTVQSRALFHFRPQFRNHFPAQDQMKDNLYNVRDFFSINSSNGLSFKSPDLF